MLTYRFQGLKVYIDSQGLELIGLEGLGSIGLECSYAYV